MAHFSAIMNWKASEYWKVYYSNPDGKNWD